MTAGALITGVWVGWPNISRLLATIVVGYWYVHPACTPDTLSQKKTCRTLWQAGTPLHSGLGSSAQTKDLQYIANDACVSGLAYICFWNSDVRWGLRGIIALGSSEKSLARLHSPYRVARGHSANHSFTVPFNLGGKHNTKTLLKLSR